MNHIFLLISDTLFWSNSRHFPENELHRLINLSNWLLREFNHFGIFHQCFFLKNKSCDHLCVHHMVSIEYTILHISVQLRSITCWIKGGHLLFTKHCDFDWIQDNRSLGTK